MKNKSVVLAVIALVVVVGVVAAIALGGNDDKKSDATTASSDSSMSNMDMSDKSSSTGDSGSASEAVATDEVEIEDYAFAPQVIKVKVGTTVTWTNKDSVQHDVTSDTQSSDAPASDLLSKGESYTFTFSKAGTYTYHCTPHPYMKGTVIVE